jgi:hypothetical protein
VQAALRQSLPLVRDATRIVIAGEPVSAKLANKRIALQRALAVRDWMLEQVPAADSVIAIDASHVSESATGAIATSVRRKPRVEIVFTLPQPDTADARATEFKQAAASGEVSAIRERLQ